MFSTPGFEPGPSRNLEADHGLRGVVARDIGPFGVRGSVPLSAGIAAVSRGAPRSDDGDQPLVERELVPTAMELDVLYRNEQHGLVRFFTRYRTSPEDARDLVQEAFLRLSRIDLRGSGSILRPTVYLRQIARNLLKDRARAARRHAVDAHVNMDEHDLVSTIMNEWAERHGKEGDRAIIDLMLAPVPKGKVEGAYNRAAYMPRRRELAQAWPDMLCSGLPAPFVLVQRPAQPTTAIRTQRFNPVAVDGEFRFPVRRRAA